MRPQFHFTASTGWINDPHGITARDGGYDVFYQYVPGQTVWSPDCVWGHARGTDLLSLVERAPAIVPGDGDGGIWTGSLVNSDAGARIFYTSVERDDFAIGRVRVATPTDAGWDTWMKGAFVAEAPPSFELVGFRDPFIRRDPDAWRMFVGAGTTEGDALALSYTSQDLDHWEYEGVALRRPTADRDPVWAGAMWECPQIFELDGRFVMLSSAWDRDVLNYAAYAVGSYDRGVFTPENWGRLTYGPSYYAPSFFRDAEGRAAITLWMRGIEDLAAGWAGAHSVPHLLSLDGDVLVATPHPDLERYWSGGAPETAADIELDEGPVVVRSGAVELFRVDTAGGLVGVTVGDQTWELPRRSPSVRLIVDAGVLEVSSDGGLLGLPLPPAIGGLQVDGDAVVRVLATRGPSPACSSTASPRR